MKSLSHIISTGIPQDADKHKLALKDLATDFKAKRNEDGSDIHEIHGIPLKHIDVYEDDNGDLKLRPTLPFVPKEPENKETTPQEETPKYSSKRERNKSGINEKPIQGIALHRSIDTEQNGNDELDLRGTPDTSLTSRRSKIIPEKVKIALQDSSDKEEAKCEMYDEWLKDNYPDLNDAQRELLYFIYLDHIEGEDSEVPVYDWSEDKKEQWRKENLKKFGEDMDAYRNKVKMINERFKWDK